MNRLLGDIFDEMDVEDIDKISNMNFKVDEDAKYRIQKSVLESAGFEDAEQIIESHKAQNGKVVRKKKRMHRLAWVASIAVLFCIGSFIGFDKIAYAFGQAFTIIPGVGVVSESEKIYIMDGEPITVNNDDLELTLENAFMNEDCLHLVMKIKYKTTMDEHEQLLNGMSLMIDGNSYSEIAGAMYDSEDKMLIGTVTFSPVKKDNIAVEINDETTCVLVYRGLSIDFAMRSDSSGSLKDIAFTDSHNDITIAAVVNQTKKCSLNLYTYSTAAYDSSQIYYGKYLYEFNKYNKINQNRNPYLELANGSIIEADMGTEGVTDGILAPENTLVFDTESVKGAKLIIPQILVKKEEQGDTITFKMPDLNETIPINKKVIFDDSTMTIKSIQKVYYEKVLGLKLDVEYSNKNANKKMIGSSMQNATWAGIEGDNGMVNAYVYFIEESEAENSSIKIAFCNPEYYYTDEYVIELEE